MTDRQRWCLAGGLVLVAVVTAVIVARPSRASVDAVKSGSAFVLLVAVLVLPKRRPGRVALTGAFALSALGDLFLVGYLGDAGGVGRIAGMACFLVAYVLVIAALTHGGLRPRGARDVVVLGGYLVVAAALLPFVAPFLDGVMRVAVPVFVAVVLTMGWTTAVMPARGHLAPDAAIWAPLGGALLVASDAGVALVFFSPAFMDPSAWFDAAIRATYTLGWVCFLLVVMDPGPRRAVAATRD